MLKVGGFPEFLPQEQKIFDKIIEIIKKNYENFNYLHIHTPAVERNKVLLAKGGDEISKQIFGLFGLAQGCEKDIKDYSLHFDLTIPFARYILDYENQLHFPFKRYQIQPVWRGERQQKGRFREFFQADIDIIFKNEENEPEDKYLYYDIEVIGLLLKTLTDIFSYFNIKNKLILRLNNKKIINGILIYFKKLGFSENFNKEFITLLDKFHKIGKEKFIEELKNITKKEGFGDNVSNKIIELFNIPEKLEKELQLAKIEEFIKGQTQLDIVSYGLSHFLKQFEISDKIEIIIDKTIVRGLDYYTGTVFETFIENEKNIGSICSGGRYDNLTGYIDPKKNYFNGVGGSIGINRLFDWLKENINISDFEEETYLIINFGYGEIFEKAFQLFSKLAKEGKKVEIYPYPEKLKKQFKYADKKGIKYVIILGEDELKNGIYKIKNMLTGQEDSIKLN